MTNLIGPLSARFDIRRTAATYLRPGCSWLKVRDYFRFLSFAYTGSSDGLIFLDKIPGQGLVFEIVTSKGLTIKKSDKIAASSEINLLKMVLILAERERLAVKDLLVRQQYNQR